MLVFEVLSVWALVCDCQVWKVEQQKVLRLMPLMVSALCKLRSCRMLYIEPHNTQHLVSMAIEYGE